MPLAQGDVVAARLFGVEIDGIYIAQFREIQGIVNEVTPIELRECTPDGLQVVTKMPGGRVVGDITLKRGKSADRGLWDWFKQVQDGDINGARRNGSIILFDFERGEVARYNFIKGWPRKVSVSNPVAAGNEPLIEECVIVHEGVELAT